MSITMSPMVNPHQSVSRRKHNLHCEHRTLTYHRRRQSLAAITSNTMLPPTPHKTRYAMSAFLGKRNHPHINKSFTPSPNKKRKKQFQQYLRKSAQKIKRLNINDINDINDINNNNNNINYQSRQFQNLGLIGIGSFSNVYKVKQVSSNKIYALKRLESQLNTRDSLSEALNEVEIMELLSNNQIPITNLISSNYEMKDQSEEQEENYEINDDASKSQSKTNSSSSSSSNSNSSSNLSLSFDGNHIIKFYQYWLSADRRLYQLYDYYKHGTLLDVIEHNERLNYLQILNIISQICFGLNLIHNLNIIHMDLKPGNIFITHDYTLKIGDFGISINLNKHQTLTPRTKSLQKCRYSGDPIYIAPELMGFDRILCINNSANNNNNKCAKNNSTNAITTATDIFSLGIILLELLCDINAPSQGIIFQNLRRNIIDFNIMEPSPIKPRNNDNGTFEIINSKSPSPSQLSGTAFSFGFDKKPNNNIVPKNNQNYDYNISEEIGNSIKLMCKAMLQRNSKLRPTSQQILDKINEIFSNNKYKNYFNLCKSFKSLSLPSENVQSQLQSINNNNQSISNSNSNSNNSFDILNSIEKQKILHFSSLDFNSLDNNQSINNNNQYFYQESPQDLNDIFNNRLLQLPHSSYPLMNQHSFNSNASSDVEEFQLNLNSAFDAFDSNNIKMKTQISVFTDHSINSDASGPSLPFSLNTSANNNAATDNDDDDDDDLDKDFEPTNLLSSFL